MRTERKPGNERSEQEGACVKPREAEGSGKWGGHSVEAEKQEAWLAGEAQRLQGLGRRPEVFMFNFCESLK